MAESTAFRYPQSTSHLRVVQNEDRPAYDADPPPERGGGRFAMIPAAVYALHEPYPILVYGALATYADRDGVCWPAMPTVAALVGVSESTVLRAIARLEESGLIAREHTTNNGMKAANRYRLIAHETLKDQSRPTDSTYHPTDSTYHPTDGNVPSHRQSRTVPQTVELEPKELQPEEQEDTPPTPPRGEARASYTDSFEQWWKLFPRKENKAKAFACWKRIRPDAGLLATILDRTRAYTTCDKVQRGYVMLPTTYLNGRRWEDDLPPAASVPARANGTYRGKDIGYTNEQLLAMIGKGGQS